MNRRLIVALALALAALVPLTGNAHGHGTHAAQAPAPDPLGHTTLEQTVVGGDPKTGFMFLQPGVGEPYILRADLAPANSSRTRTRRSLAYFAQITDFQLADEESPARVEFLDPDPSGTATSAWRPQEALVPHQVDWTIRQVNRFVDSPLLDGRGKRAKMLNAVMTGDLADNAQRNETEWVVRLLEGGRLDPNSGTSDLSGTVCPPGTPLDDPRNYTGVQDYSDYPAFSTNFYDPDQPAGQYASWPTYPGLMDRAQQPFDAEGLKVPSYIAFGNHDSLAQGNEDPNAAFEEVATGCVKPIAPQPGFVNPLQPNNPLVDALPPLTALDPTYLASVAGDATRTMLVPPDPNRQYVDKIQFKQLNDTGKQADKHGFAYVDPAELQASNGAASYYAWSPRRGVRFVVLDTVADAGVTPESSDGNIDDPQFQWLTRELTAASARDELIVVFGHHARTSLSADVRDEIAPPCVAADEHGHDVNPGCDRDPRNSEPVRLGEDLQGLLHQHPRVVAYVAGHSHENEVQAYRDGDGSGYWEIKSPAVVDWPPQHRLIEVMDNCDSTLSIFATLLDHAGPVKAADPGTPAASIDPAGLASVGRTISYNDPQGGPDGSQGEPIDRNVELTLPDPRTGTSAVRSIRLSVTPKKPRAGRTVRFALRVTTGSGSARRSVPGAVVRLGGKRATTDSRGRASIRLRVRTRRALTARATLPGNGCTSPVSAKVRPRPAAVRRRGGGTRRGPSFTG